MSNYIHIGTAEQYRKARDGSGSYGSGYNGDNLTHDERNMRQTVGQYDTTAYYKTGLSPQATPHDSRSNKNSKSYANRRSSAVDRLLTDASPSDTANAALLEGTETTTDHLEQVDSYTNSPQAKLKHRLNNDKEAFTIESDWEGKFL